MWWLYQVDYGLTLMCCGCTVCTAVEGTWAEAVITVGTASGGWSKTGGSCTGLCILQFITWPTYFWVPVYCIGYTYSCISWYRLMKHSLLHVQLCMFICMNVCACECIHMCVGLFQQADESQSQGSPSKQPANGDVSEDGSQVSQQRRHCRHELWQRPVCNLYVGVCVPSVLWQCENASLYL